VWCFAHADFIVFATNKGICCFDRHWLRNTTTILRKNLPKTGIFVNKGDLLSQVFLFYSGERKIVRGFSLVLHDPEGSHCKIWG
jgi:hypothetical protein